MFKLFNTPDFDHPTLGVLRWSRGCWRGQINLLGHDQLPLVLGGTRREPDVEALSQATGVPAALARVRANLASALFEHYEPYAEAAREGHLKPENGRFPVVRSAEEALQAAKPIAVLIVSLDGETATELCYEVPWDEEHILGARFRGDTWIELCGSTLIP